MVVYRRAFLTGAKWLTALPHMPFSGQTKVVVGAQTLCYYMERQKVVEF